MARQAARRQARDVPLVANHQPQTFSEIPDAYVLGFVEHAKETSRPETYPGLWYLPLPNDELFRIRAELPPLPKNRTVGDAIPCPMCWNRSKFSKNGYLVHMLTTGRVALIGHNCAKKEVMDEALREYKATEELKQNEAWLREKLPLTLQALVGVGAARRSQETAATLINDFNKDAKETRNQIRRAVQGDTELRIDVNGQFQYYGKVAGHVAFSGQLRVKEYLDKAESLITKNRCEADQASVNKRIADLYDADALNNAASELRNATELYDKFVGKMDEFCSFFTLENIAVIDRWGKNLDQFVRFSIGYSTIGAKRVIAINAVNEATRLEASGQMWMYPRIILA